MEFYCESNFKLSKQANASLCGPILNKPTGMTTSDCSRQQYR